MRPHQADLSEHQIAAHYSALYSQLAPLLRKTDDTVRVYMQEVAASSPIVDTKASAHCYFISLDGNKQARLGDFARFLATKITDFAIPRNRVVKALNEAVRKGSTAPIDKLNIEAKALFTRQPLSGEGGEVLLSVLAETYLGLPQLFTKMPLKTSGEMHVHGSDGIHAGVNEQGHLALYWGESKLYADVSEAIGECLTSLAPFLVKRSGTDAASRRDIHLLRDGIDLPDEKLVEALKRYLDPDDEMYSCVEFRGLCLIAFDSSCYPATPNTKAANEVKAELELGLQKLASSFKNRARTKLIETFLIEVFFIPMPSVGDFRLAFRKELGFVDE